MKTSAVDAVALLKQHVVLAVNREARGFAQLSSNSGLKASSGGFRTSIKRAAQARACDR